MKDANLTIRNFEIIKVNFWESQASVVVDRCSIVDRLGRERAMWVPQKNR